ncbi:transglycosylase SLT domain-containing protein [Streptococcus dysgalactiae]|uniref:transglycosylase SLT domain-containing protein n=1 Tax=Streptococcus dysgalactiae TaxID=1334 RepID=UPI003530FBAC
MLKKENLKQRYFSFGVIAVAIAMLAVIFAFSSKNVDTDSYAKKSEPKVIKKVKKAKKTSQAAAQMAAATGVPQSTWEHIIARESNGNPSAANASGASGLFQTMPGWGSTATVQDQVNSALNAYRAQGLSAWGY